MSAASRARALAMACSVGPAYTGRSKKPPPDGHPATMVEPTETYENPESNGGWQYVIEAPDESWIAFVAKNGRTLLWTVRDKNGGCVGLPYEFERIDLRVMDGYEAKQYPNKLTKSRRVGFARAVEASADGVAPSAARLWRAGWNDTDKGRLNYTLRSAKLVLAAAAKRGNPIVWYYDHEDRIPQEKRGGAPMRGACSASSSVLANRDTDAGPECWAESIGWTAEAKRQIETGERRQLSPIAAFDEDTREIIEIINVSLCCEGATHRGTLLASKGQNMDELLQKLMDAIDAMDWEACETIIQQLEAADGGAMSAKMGRMAVKAAKDGDEVKPPAADDVAEKKLAAAIAASRASQGGAVAVFTRELAAEKASLALSRQAMDVATKETRRTNVRLLITLSRDYFDAADERQHLDAADPVATERHIASMARKVKAGVVVLNRDGAADADANKATIEAGRGNGDVKPPKGPASKDDKRFGLSDIDIATALQHGVPLESYAKSKASVNGASGRKAAS